MPPSFCGAGDYIATMPIARLDRSVLKISGDGVTDWLAGLITNSLTDDINFAALLTPQGKIIADFFVIKDGESWLIDVADKYAQGLQKRLSMYKLRAPITIEDTAICVYAAWDGEGDEGLEDSRHPGLGRRIYGDLECEGSQDDYDAHRLSLGIPDSAFDFDTSEVFPAGANMDRLNGVDFKKGCFVGQEVVSRMYRKTEVKKRMRGFRYEGELDGDQIKAGERVVGDIMHSRDVPNGGWGMAMIRHDRLPEDGTPLMIEDREITLLDLP